VIPGSVDKSTTAEIMSLRKDIVGGRMSHAVLVCRIPNSPDTVPKMVLEPNLGQVFDGSIDALPRVVFIEVHVHHSRNRSP